MSSRDIGPSSTMEEILQAQLRDEAQAWDLQPDGSYRRIEAHGARCFSAQSAALEAHATVAKRA